MVDGLSEGLSAAAQMAAADAWLMFEGPAQAAGAARKALAYVLVHKPDLGAPEHRNATRELVDAVAALEHWGVLDAGVAAVRPARDT